MENFGSMVDPCRGSRSVRITRVEGSAWASFWSMKIDRVVGLCPCRRPPAAAGNLQGPPAAMGPLPGVDCSAISPKKTAGPKPRRRILTLRSGLAEQAQHRLVGLRGERQRRDRELLPGLQGHHV